MAKPLFHSENTIPFLQQDFRCPCGVIHLRGNPYQPWAQYTCPCGWNKFVFNGPPAEGRVLRLGDSLGATVRLARR